MVGYKLGYLSLDIICSSKLSVFLELRFRKTVRFSEQDKYPSIFSRQMESIDYVCKWLLNTRVWKTKTILNSHKYCSALAHKRKGLRLKWEDENIVNFFSYEIQICSHYCRLDFYAQGHNFFDLLNECRHNNSKTEGRFELSYFQSSKIRRLNRQLTHLTSGWWC